jgi:ATP-dependent RNA helicase DeaD
MLSVGFYPDMVKMAAYLPSRRDGFMFSATYPPSVISLAGQFLRNPEMLSLSHGSEHVAETEHVAYEVAAMEKPRALVRIIELENPDSAIIFCNTKAQVEFVAKVLRNFGYDAEPVSGDLNQHERERVLGRTYEKKLRFLVATDLAGRGIDIPNLSHVILYDFPEDPEAYIHRTGRTGRAGASGEAISLVDLLEKLQLSEVVRRYGIDLQWRPVPAPEEVAVVVSERVTALLEAKLRELRPLLRERMERMLPLARRLGENDDELALMAMMLDEYYQESLHAPPDVPERSAPAEAPRPARRRESGRKQSGPRHAERAERDAGSKRRRRRGGRRP